MHNKTTNSNKQTQKTEQNTHKNDINTPTTTI